MDFSNFNATDGFDFWVNWVGRQNHCKFSWFCRQNHRNFPWFCTQPFVSCLAEDTGSSQPGNSGLSSGRLLLLLHSLHKSKSVAIMSFFLGKVRRSAASLGTTAWVAGSSTRLYLVPNNVVVVVVAVVGVVVVVAAVMVMTVNKI